MAFEAWWDPSLKPIERIINSYYVLKVFKLWKRWLQIADFDEKVHFITLEQFRDTIIMCSSLVHLALIFKIYFPNKPFIPWRWSEYPMENHFSSMRFLFGNDDEFSTLEYSHRSKRLQNQNHSPTPVDNSRIKDTVSRWNHPHDVSKETFPNLFRHDWKISDLLLGFESVDHKIRFDFQKLGMSSELADEDLFKALSPADRLEQMKSQLVGDDLISKFIANDTFASDTPVSAPLKSNSTSAESSLTIQEPSRKRTLHKSKALRLSVGGVEITASKYLTCYKQRNDRKASGQRNVKRFWNEDDALSGETEEEAEEEYFIGDFIQTFTYGLLEILQLRKNNKYVHREKLSDNLQCIAVPYKWNEGRTYFAEASYIHKNYLVLKEFKMKKVKCLSTWKEGDIKYVEIDQEIPENIVLEHHVYTESSKAEKYCFCRKPDTDGGDYIQCSNHSCKLEWYHLKCVKLKAAPPEDKKWTCPRCKLNANHWCTCGKKAEINKMISCTNDSCPIGKFHFKCVGLYSKPAGPWYCDECLENIEIHRSVCLCEREINLDEVVTCRNRKCPVGIFHKCCIKPIKNDSEWYCVDCS